jgi:hypothetical protein
MLHADRNIHRQERLGFEAKSEKERGAHHKKPNKHKMRQIMKEQRKIVSKYIEKTPT